MTANGWTPSIDDLSFGTTGPQVTGTPEPSTLALMVTGLIGMVGVARRNRKR